MPNDPATGAPTISGTTRVNETLTAVTTDIADANGLTTPNYTYQWVRIDGTDETDISGAINSTYILTDEDADKKIKVKVSFDDDLINPEGPLTSLPTITVAGTDVLVRNTGQTSSGTARTLTSDINKYAQPFTTGANAAGYGLSSIGFVFHTIADTATVGDHMNATLNADNSGSPGDVLCTLTDPTSFSASGQHTFDAPTINPCPALTASTTYYAVIDRVTITADIISLEETSSTDEDNGSVADWSIGNDRHFFNFGWNKTSSGSTAHQIEVKGEAIVPLVPRNWALTPSGLTTGDKFRLLFLTYSGRAPTSTDIADYNTYVQNQANRSNAHAAIKPHRSGFRVVGCTAAKDARDNTETTYTATDKGVPIYWLDGNKVVDDYEDFYDGGWDDEANPKDRAGNAITPQLGYVWTGCRNDGTAKPSTAFGNTNVEVGRLDSAGSPLSAGSSTSSSLTTYSYYALSGVFVVPNSPATGAPTITGTPRVNEVLTANTSGIADEDGLTSPGYEYQWVRFDGINNTDISGATSSTYTVKPEDAGKQIKVKVTFTDDLSYPEGPLYSLLTDAVNTPATGAPTISGSPRVGQTLTAHTSAISDADGTGSATFTYQWMRYDGTSDTDIAGATSSTYTLKPEDAGKQVKVRVTFTDDEGYSEGPFTSQPTASVIHQKLLVKNTSVSAGHIAGIPNGTRQAQAFTTGAHISGYQISSIGVKFGTIDNLSAAGADLQATINEVDNSGQPSSVVCTLNDPPAFTSNQVNHFSAPSTGECPALEPETTYFVVLERVASTTGTPIRVFGGIGQRRGRRLRRWMVNCRHRILRRRHNLDPGKYKPPHRGQRGALPRDHGPDRVEPDPHRPHGRTKIPPHVPHLHRLFVGQHRHRGLQRLRPEPGQRQQRSRRHQGLQHLVPRARQHRGRGRPRQHEHEP